MQRLFVKGLLLAALATLVIGCDAPIPDKLAVHLWRSTRLGVGDEPSSPAGNVIVSRPSITAIAVRDHVAHVTGMGRLFAIQTGSFESILSVDTQGSAADVAVWEDQLFVADGSRGLTRYRLDELGRPTFSKHDAAPSECFRVVASARGFAALCNHRNLVFVAPGQEPKFIPLPANAMDVGFLEASLFVASSGNGLMRVEIGSEKPVVMVDQAPLDRILSIAVLENRLFVGLRDKRILELDPATVAVKGEVAILNRPMRLVGGKNHLLVGSTWPGDPGATWVDTSDAAHLRVLGRLPFSVATGAYVQTNQWIVARPEGGTALVTTDGRVVREMAGVRFDRVVMAPGRGLSWTENREAAWMFEAGEEHLEFLPRKVADAATCGNGLCVLESSGRLCRYRRNEAAAECMEVAEGCTSLAYQPNRERLWVSDANGGFHGITMTPELRDGVSIPHVATTAAQNLGRMAIDGDRAAVIDVDMGILQVLDVGSTPRARGYFLLHSLPTAVAMVGDDVFVAVPRGGIQVVRVTQPDGPQEVAWQALTGAVGIAAMRDDSGRVFVFVAEGERGLSSWVWQSEQRRLEKLRRVAIVGMASDVFVRDSHVFVAAGGNIVKLPLSELVQ